MAYTDADDIRKKFNLLSPNDLRKIRFKIGIDCNTADSLFGLRSGYYLLFESGRRLQSTAEDNVIRATNILNDNGFKFLSPFIKRRQLVNLC